MAQGRMRETFFRKPWSLCLEKSKATAFQQLSQNDPNDISYQFYLAVAQLGAKENDASITLFQKIIATENHPFKEQSQWYLALAFLQNNNIESAKKIIGRDSIWAV